jgi:alpha-mannosidase
MNDMEDILMLREYLHRHPDSKNEIHQLGLSGKLFWGASYIQPYEEMYFGESLIRQFYLGKKWFEKEFPGCKSEVYWNFDVPGRTLQMPQILAKSGVGYMMISRHDMGMFYWSSPDGSKVLTYSPGHYYNDYVQLKQGFFKTVSHIANLAGPWSKLYEGAKGSPVMPILSDADMALPDMYFDYIHDWNALANGKDKLGNQRKLPTMFHSSAIAFLKAAENSGAAFKTIQGERPAVWLYIHGPSHFEALRYGRSASRTLPAAEKMATIRSILDGNWSSYPSERLTQAWEKGIYPDHGWGGNQGTITDSTFLAKFFQADSTAKNIIMESAEGIASSIQFKPDGIPVVVFNSLSWKRTDPVQFTLELPDRKLKNFKIINSEGKEVMFQQTDGTELYPSGYLKKINLLIIAENIPSLGYATFYVVQSKGKLLLSNMLNVSATDISTPFYQIRLNESGMVSLFDKELGREIWQTDQFGGGELFTLQSIGNGAGEFADVQQPDTTGFERMKDLGGTWTVTENGPIRMKIRTMGSMKHNRMGLEWTIYKTIKRIDVKADLIDWDGTAYREFRLAFPVNLNQPQLSYEVPFGVVNVGKDEIPGAAGERYVTACKDVHPRGINNWFSASDGQSGITISSSVAVWDYVNMTQLPTSATLLQPILMASRQSCHGLGPLYHQRGSHSMEFSLFTHKPGWMNGYQNAIQANEPLIAVVNPSSESIKLPDNKSFVTVSGSSAIVSTLKKEEFGDGVILRIYDTQGKDNTVTIDNQLFKGKVFKTNLLEENPAKFTDDSERMVLPLGHHSIETLMIKKN